MGQRLLALVVVIASACTALHFSSTERESVVVNNNNYIFNGAGSAIFTLSAPGADHDLLQTIQSMCSSQWTLDTTYDAQQPVLGAHVCGSGSGSASTPTATVETSDANPTCPRNYQFRVSFAGTQAGSQSCNVEIRSMSYFGGSATNLVTLSMVGIGSAQGITVSPDSMDFKDVPMGQMSGSDTVTITNVGTTSLNVSGALTTGTDYVVGSGYQSFQLGSGASRQFEVRCRPLTLGLKNDTLTFTSGQGSSNTGSVTLTCKGIISTIDINPSPVAFAKTLVGRAPPSKTVTITSNNGSATIETVTLDAAATAAGVTITTNPQGMAVGGGKDVVLAYSAAETHDGGPLGALLIKVSTDATAREVGISGQALVGGLGTNPASVEFGAVCAGNKQMKDIEVYASEPGDVVLQQMTKPVAPFDATLMDSVPKTLGGNHTGANMMVRTTFDPKEPGDFKDKIVLTSDVPGTATKDVVVHGLGLAPGIAATPAMVHFGLGAVMMTTSIKEVQFTNCGSSDLTFNRAYISGPDVLEFTLIGAYPTKVLKPGESVTFMVVMQPKTNGLKAAKLMIEHDQGVTTADLDGQAEGGSDKDRETYYACSTGRSGALWPIAVALLALRRRRR